MSYIDLPGKEIDRKGSQTESSSENSENEIEGSPKTLDDLNSVNIKFYLGDNRTATIIYNSLVVDTEPKRSRSNRTLSVDGAFLIASISSDDPKSLIKSVNNFSEMCLLSKSTIEAIKNYSLTSKSK